MAIPALIAAAAPSIIALLGQLLSNRGGGQRQQQAQQQQRGSIGLEDQVNQATLNQMLQLMQGGQQDLQDPYQGFQGIKDDAMRTFFEEIVPGLKESFAASGSNAYSSPVLQSQLSQAGGTLASRLGALQSQYGQNQQQLGLSKLGQGMTYFPEKPSAWAQLGSSLGGPLLSAAGTVGGAYLGARSQNKLADAISALAKK